jgi:hypothetical protein
MLDQELPGLFRIQFVVVRLILILCRILNLVVFNNVTKQKSKKLNLK